MDSIKTHQLGQDNKVVQLCDLLAFYCFCVLIFVLPISKGLTETCSFLVLIFFFYKRSIFLLQTFRYGYLNEIQSNRKSIEFLKKVLCAIKLKSTFLNRFAVTFILINFFSIFSSQIHLLSLKGFIFKWLEQFILLFAAVEVLSDKKKISSFVLSLLAGLSLMAVNSFWQLFKGIDFLRSNLLTEGRVTSSFGHPNDYAAYLVVAVGVLFGVLISCFSASSWAIRSESKTKTQLINGRILISMLMISSLVVLGLTFSRGAWVGVAVAFGFVTLNRKRLIFFCVPALILFYIVFSPKMLAVRDVSLFEDYVSTVKTEVSVEHETKESMLNQLGSDIRDFPNNLYLKVTKFGGMGRSGFWKQAFDIIKDYPVLGAGVNTYAKVVTRYQFTYGWYPHNCYLHMAAEIGLLGLGSFLLMLLVLFIKVIKVVNVTQDPFIKNILLGSSAGLFGFLVHSFVDTNFYSVQLGALLWVINGCNCSHY